jgi:tetratricopeptide (TPR) repeat protein
MGPEKEADPVDNFVEKLYSRDYIPSPLVSEKAFLSKKKHEMEDGAQKMLERAYNGIALFSLVSTDSPGINNLIANFLKERDPSKFLEKTEEEIRNIPTEEISYDLTESDFQILMAFSDQTYQSQAYNSAIALYQSLTVLFPLHMESWLKWGNVVYQHFECQDALKIFEECLTLFPHPAVYSGIGLCHIKLKNYEKAKEYFELALAKSEEIEDTEIKAEVLSLLEDLKPFVR